MYTTYIDANLHSRKMKNNSGNLINILSIQSPQSFLTGPVRADHLEQPRWGIICVHNQSRGINLELNHKHPLIVAKKIKTARWIKTKIFIGHGLLLR